MTTTQYMQLQPEDWVTIASLKQQGQGVRAIARTLGRTASTVSRELRRNAVAGIGYASTPAHKAAHARRAAARPRGKLDLQGKLWTVVSTCLSWRWSPQQIAATLARMWPDDASMHVSHETIYTAIYAHASGELRRQLITCLRQGKSTHKRRSAGEDQRGRIPKMVSIHVRSPAAPLRQTLTYDQGCKMASYRALTERTGVKVYFCDPHNFWQ